MDIQSESSDMDLYRSLTSAQVSRLQHLYLFPRNYEFHKDEVIQLWIAQELVPLPPSADMEFCADSYFKEFEELGIFQLSTLDYSAGQQRYKLSNSFVNLLAQNRGDEFFRIDDVNSHISENTKHSSLRDESIHPVTLNELYKAERLTTLFILHQNGSHLNQIPRDLFLNLLLLRVLDLSHTSLTELPSSIGILKDLRYLNLSYTPITTLPKSLCSLHQLQTLKLKGCLKLVGLPKGVRKLINLRHLEVELDCLLVSMPPGLGDLAELQTLPAFVVGKENGCHITELRNMMNLCGTLSILRLENVSNSVEAKLSALDNKKYLQNVELHWTDCVDGLEVLENLQPYTELEELQIVGYGGVKFPNWIGDPIFSKLATITISDCRNCELLPPVWKLPSLQCLTISDMHAVKKIDSTFCGRKMVVEPLGFKTFTLKNFRPDDMFKAFQNLEKLTLNGMPVLETWSGIAEGNFPNLQKLSISHCPKLTSLPKLSLLISLQELEISLCPLLESFPDKGLPTSLRCLVIIGCPRLEVVFHKGERKYWGKLPHIPNIWIDYQQIIQVIHRPTAGDSGLAFQNLRAIVQMMTGTYVEEGKRTGVGSSMIKPHGNPGDYWSWDMEEAEAKPQIPALVQRDVNLELTTSTSAAGSAFTVEGSTSSCISLQTSDTNAAGEQPLVEQIRVEDTGSQQVLEGDHRGAYAPTATGRSSEDGYNWRKYGQKAIKGSEYPRSYYKCSTKKNCQAKKKIDRSHDGQITEIIYKGRHNHPMPHPAKDNNVNPDWRGDRQERTSSTSVVTEVSDPLSTAQGKHLGILEFVDTPEISCTVRSHEEDKSTLGSISLGDDTDDYESKSKRRKTDSSLIEANLASRAVRESRIVVQTVSELGIPDDGYWWRKYGEKIVKGNPIPRRYYKCMSSGCPARKNLERAAHDLKDLTITYEGKHNHEIPAASSSHLNSAGGSVSSPFLILKPQLVGVLRSNSDPK